MKHNVRLADGSAVMVHTDFVYPPIPVRSMDWSAVTDNYDGAPDCNDPVGRGATEAEAIADLLNQMEVES